MFRLLGSRKVLCDGLSRRDLLHVGGLGALGLTLADALRLQAQASPASAAGFGRAKACILVFPFGSPPQHETFDPKPDAPREIQGEMGAIPTALPGVSIGEGLPRIAQILDRMTVVRSMTHPYPVHGVAYALTGMPTYTPAIEADPKNKDHWPFLGSVVDYLDEQRAGGAMPRAPRNLGLPWQFGTKSTLPTLAGPYAAFLGAAYDPVWTEFSGPGTQVAPKLTDGQTEEVRDPFGGITPEGRFQLMPTGELPQEVSLARLGMRRSLLAQFDQARAHSAAEAETALDKHHERAFDLLANRHVRDALDVQRESAAVRDRYGMTLFGQSLLAARRLVEAGGRFVSVFWDPFGPFGGSCWDTHANHFPRLREYLLPVFDQGFAALIGDLEERGLLEETAVICVSEHGRTPQIDNKPRGAARHHWSRVYSAVFAGGGLARGHVVGRSDPHGGDVAETAVSPKDILATTLHLLGIDPHTLVRDRLNRPLPVCGDGRVRSELLA